MREIEFRIKDRDAWYYGLPLSKVKKDKDTVAFGSGDGNYYNLLADVKTLGQYIGLKDKNGQKIYEGDIVRIFANNYDEKLVFRIVYCEDIAQFEIVGNDLCITFDNVYNYEVEVIGNVWDNPELLDSL